MIQGFKEMDTCDVQAEKMKVHFLRWSIVGSPILEKQVMLGVFS